jgi:F0F1-type ATP synthase assembly protein I
VSARRSDQSDLWQTVGAVSGLGFVLFASIGGGYFLGWLVDRWLGTAPIFGLILAGLGLAGGLMEILQILKRVEKRAGRNDNGSSEN